MANRPDKSKAPTFKHFRSSSARASKHLASIKADGSKAECVLRGALHRRGFRFRKNVKSLPGKPDIVFSRQRLAIFCDGDFWHGKDWQRDRKRLENGPNSEYWVNKIQRNIERDKACRRELRKMGWRVMSFWESDILAQREKISSKVINHLLRLDVSIS